MKIDLHTHTYFSDGSYSPTEVVNMAVERGVEYLAISDHDVITGIEEAQKAAKGKPIKIIPGMEISARVKCSDKDIHLLCLYIDPKNPLLIYFSENVQKAKIEKTKRKLEMLNKNLNIKITLDDLKAKTKGMPSSPHIWMVLIDKGLAKDIKEGRDITVKHATVPENSTQKIISSEEAIKMIHNSGGLVLLAHPAAYKNENKFVSFEEQEELIKELKSYGLDGLEIYTPDTNEKELKFGKKMAKKYKLSLSCGSDFHDEKFIPQNKIGFLDIEKEKISALRD